MPKDHPVPVEELVVAVQSAVKQVLGEHSATPSYLWIGYYAPEDIATQANADAIAAKLGAPGQGSVATIAPTETGAADAERLVRPGPKIIGYKIISKTAPGG